MHAEGGETSTGMLKLQKRQLLNARHRWRNLESRFSPLVCRHTFTAFFFVGCAILLASARAADGSSSPVSAFIRRNSAPLLVLGGVTAVGRVLSDVHWASDTMAGEWNYSGFLGFKVQNGFKLRRGGVYELFVGNVPE